MFFGLNNTLVYIDGLKRIVQYHERGCINIGGKSTVKSQFIYLFGFVSSPIFYIFKSRYFSMHLFNANSYTLLSVYLCTFTFIVSAHIYFLFFPSYLLGTSLPPSHLQLAETYQSDNRPPSQTHTLSLLLFEDSMSLASLSLFVLISVSSLQRSSLSFIFPFSP